MYELNLKPIRNVKDHDFYAFADHFSVLPCEKEGLPKGPFSMF